MMIPVKYHPVPPAIRTGFGFDTIMAEPDYRAFPIWYARSSRLGQDPARRRGQPK